ncbi:ComEA family DNA-binding protein [Streptomyces oceani]|uniref:ComEA family DNA-binding protein n=1 Tax=Streptomyces oceani TaxID=1075402 RepID=UPI001FCD8C54|nr:ComEA family DNA-binding protein [Streptomyces oceani]
MLERLPPWVQLRCGVEPKTLAALAVVLLVAVGFAVHHFWSGRPQPVRPPKVSAGSPTSDEAPEPSASGGKRVTVEVTGDVEDPGIQRLPPGSRVTDALKAAGGLTSGADTKGLNQARRLVDGEQISVGDKPPAPAAAGAAPPGSAPSDPSGASTGGAGVAQSRISLSSASAQQLEQLPGVGPVLAQHIIEFRTEHAGFASIEQLKEVSGIGEARFAELESLVIP